jgi:hypothetical protein
MKLLMTVVILYLAFITIELKKAAKNQELFISFINKQGSEITELREKIENIKVLEKVVPEIRKYCSDKGGDPFFVASESAGILNCANKGSFKMFINLEKYE